MTEQTQYPLEYSMRGDNTLYIGCESRGARQNYAICLNVIKAQNEGRRKQEDYCYKEIKCKSCQALKMRQEEMDAGYALHYAPRKKVEVKPQSQQSGIMPASSAKDSEGYRRGFEYAGKMMGKDKSPATKQKVESRPEAKPTAPVMDIAGVVSQMAREHAASKAEPTALDRARQLREKLQKRSVK